MLRKVFDWALGLFIFLVSTAYTSGQKFDDTQGLVFRVSILILFIIAMNLKPIRFITNKWVNSLLGLCLLTTIILPENVQKVAILPMSNAFLGVVLFYLIANYMENKKVILNALCGVVGVMAVMAILQVTGNDPIVLNESGQKNTSMVGLFTHKYVLGAYMGIIAPFLLWNKRRTFAIIAIILTICSMSWIAIGTCLIVCSVPLWGIKKAWGIASIGVIIIVALIAYFGVLRVPTYYTTNGITSTHPNSLFYKIKSRQDTQLKFLPVLASRPIQGFGLGMFQHIGPTIVNNKTDIYGTMKDAWCDFLEKSIELGVGFLILFFFLCRDIWRRADKFSPIFVTIAGIPVLMMFHSLLNHYSLGVLFLSLLALWEVEYQTKSVPSILS